MAVESYIVELGDQDFELLILLLIEFAEASVLLNCINDTDNVRSATD